MAWIESHQTLGRHPKTKRLARALGVSIVQAVGHLQFFWWWALDFAHDGILDGMTDEDIADGAMWEGPPATFVEAMRQAGFIDCGKANEPMTIHDWWEYAGRLVQRRNDNADRMRIARAQHVPDTCAARSKMCEATVPNQPNQTNLHDPQLQQPNSPAEQIQIPSSKPGMLFDEDSTPYQAAEMLRKKILDRNPGAKVPKLDSPAFQGWCHHIDLLLRVDKRDIDEIIQVIYWCQDDEFWHQNILSTRNLRDKYDRLYLKMLSSRNHRSERGKSPAPLVPFPTGPPVITLAEAEAQGVKF